MSENDDLKQQLETIQKLLVDIHASILKALEGISKEHESMGKLSDLTREINEINDKLQQRFSFSLLYFSILLSALVGVIGNYFVALLSLPPSDLNTKGLYISGIILVGIFVLLLIGYWKYK